MDHDIFYPVIIFLYFSSLILVFRKLSDLMINKPFIRENRQFIDNMI